MLIVPLGYGSLLCNMSVGGEKYLDVQVASASLNGDQNGSPNMSWSKAKKALIRRDTPSQGVGGGEPSGGSLEGADPELCITLLERGLNFTGLKNRLRAADQGWMEQFITLGGITALFDALEALGRRGFSSITDALRQLECVACVKAVMNNRFGLEFIIETTGEAFVRKLAEGGLARGSAGRAATHSN